MNGQKGRSERPVFTFVSPHYHNGWVWEPVTELLQEQGYGYLPVDLPISDPDMTRDDHAAIMRSAEEELGAENYIRVGASWGGDIIYREIGSHISKLVFKGAPLRPVINKLRIPNRRSELENSPALAYHAIAKAVETGEGEFDRDALGEVFYRDIGDTALREWATDQLQPHPHVPETNDNNAVLPDDMDMQYVGLVNDRILPYDRQKGTAGYLDMDFIPFPSGHFAMLERPRKLADLLVQIANKNINYEGWWELERQERQKKLDRRVVLV